MHPAWILIIDFGSQYTELIVRRFRELHVYAEVVPHHDTSWIARRPLGIVLSGGPCSVSTHDAPTVPEAVWSMGVPVLGICYGMQAMAQRWGGRVTSASQQEFGLAQLQVHAQPGSLWAGMHTEPVWMSHGDHVVDVPPGFTTDASSDQVPVASMLDQARQWYGVQCHPEVTHTQSGLRLLTRFLDTTGIERNWQPADWLPQCLAAIRHTVGTRNVLLGLSGGVDSTVLAVLLRQAIGSQLIPVLVDHGLMRAGEVQDIQNVLGKQLGIVPHVVQAQAQFFQALSGVTHSETKRHIIGKTFVEVFEQAAQQHDIGFLAQGTICSDVLESAGHGQHKARIKSHHNVAGLPERMPFPLLEPFRHLFKDEVRQLGAQLGIPESWLRRHPFPGPGLGVRVLGAVDPGSVRLLQQADAIFLEELHRAGWYHRVGQAFAVLLPVQSVGVKGDARCEGPVVALRAVSSDDFMTAHVVHLPWSLIDTTARRITNEVVGISRVVLDISAKPPATIEWE